MQILRERGRGRESEGERERNRVREGERDQEKGRETEEPSKCEMCTNYNGCKFGFNEVINDFIYNIKSCIVRGNTQVNILLY